MILLKKLIHGKNNDRFIASSTKHISSSGPTKPAPSLDVSLCRSSPFQPATPGLELPPPIVDTAFTQALRAAEDLYTEWQNSPFEDKVFEGSLEKKPKLLVVMFYLLHAAVKPPKQPFTKWLIEQFQHQEHLGPRGFHGILNALNDFANIGHLDTIAFNPTLTAWVEKAIRNKWIATIKEEIVTYEHVLGGIRETIVHQSALALCRFVALRELETNTIALDLINYFSDAYHLELICKSVVFEKYFLLLAETLNLRKDSTFKRRASRWVNEIVFSAFFDTCQVSDTQKLRCLKSMQVMLAEDLLMAECVQSEVKQCLTG